MAPETISTIYVVCLILLRALYVYVFMPRDLGLRPRGVGELIVFALNLELNLLLKESR